MPHRPCTVDARRKNKGPRCRNTPPTDATAERNGRKTLTTVQGLPKKFDQKKILKVIKKKFACNGTIVSDAEMGEVVQLQGDQRKDVQDFLTDKKEGLGLDAKTIKVSHSLTFAPKFGDNIKPFFPPHQPAKPRTDVGILFRSTVSSPESLLTFFLRAPPPPSRIFRPFLFAAAHG